MKKSLFLILSIFAMINAYGQTGTGNLQVNYITIDLTKPSIAYDSLSSSKSVRLEMKSKELNVFRLLHANTIRYNYILNRSFIQFNTSGTNPIDLAVNTLSGSTSQNAATAKKADSTKKTSDTLSAAKKTLDAKKASLVAAQAGKKAQIKKPAANPKASFLAAQSKNLKDIKDLDIKITKVSAQIDKNDQQLTSTNAKYYETADGNGKQKFLDNFNSMLKTQEIDFPAFKVFEQADTALLEKQYLMLLQKIGSDLNLATQTLQGIIDEASNKNSMDYNFDYKLIAKEINFLNDVNNAYLNTFLDPDADFSNLNKTAVATATNIAKLYTSVSSLNKDEYLLPLDVNGQNIDLVRVQLQISEKNTPTTLDTYNYDVYIKGGLKIDFSAGAFLTKLIDNSYSLRDTTDNGVAKKIIERKNSGDFNFGVGSMINMSLRTGASWIAPALSVGALFSNQQKLQFLLGLTAICGKEQRLAFHGGLTMGSVTYLDSSYKVGGAYALGAVTTPPTIQKFLTSTFSGITYNLTQAKVATPNAVK